MKKRKRDKLAVRDKVSLRIYLKQCLKTTPEQRLNWLEQAFDFFSSTRSIRKRLA